MLKQLSRIYSLEYRCTPPKKKLQQLIERAGGDLRCAILSMQFWDAHDMVSRDVSMDLFHILGRILYSKRIESLYLCFYCAFYVSWLSLRFLHRSHASG
jgi:hypothetical protein